MTEKQPPSYPLRMPQELREQLATVAKANNRSMNAEIVARLEQTFQAGTPSAIDVGWLATELAQRLSGNGLQLAVIDGASSSPLSSDVRTTAVPLSKAEQPPAKPNKT